MGVGNGSGDEIQLKLMERREWDSQRPWNEKRSRSESHGAIES
jgi:hypothetical protein